MVDSKLVHFHMETRILSRNECKQRWSDHLEKMQLKIALQPLISNQANNAWCHIQLNEPSNNVLDI